MPHFADADDMDCEPFVDDGGPSDDNITAQHEQVLKSKIWEEEAKIRGKHHTYSCQEGHKNLAFG